MAARGEDESARSQGIVGRWPLLPPRLLTPLRSRLPVLGFWFGAAVRWCWADELGAVAGVREAGAGGLLARGAAVSVSLRRGRGQGQGICKLVAVR